MLAGKVKLKTFLVGVGALAVLALGAFTVGGIMLTNSGLVVIDNMEQERAEAVRAHQEKLAKEARRDAERQPTQPAPAAAPQPAPLGDTTRAFDAVVLGYAGTDLGTSKKKDVTRGKPYKVNVYQDGGHSTANRAKVDKDRDDQWDEKWTFGEGISRKVAPNDDENYTEVWLWDGQNWALE